MDAGPELECSTGAVSEYSYLLSHLSSPVSSGFKDLSVGIMLKIQPFFKKISVLLVLIFGLFLLCDPDSAV